MNNIIGRDIEKAAALLKEGRVVAIPTETVYGLAADALNEKAVKRIFEVKDRPAVNPLIVHLANADLIPNYASDIPDVAGRLIDAFCPGPLTIVLSKKAVVPGMVTANRDTVALRIPAHPVTRQLLKMTGLPLAAPSANPSGYISPTSAEHVFRNMGHKIDYILDGGVCNAGIESTIVGFENDLPVIYRQGVITADDIRLVAGEVLQYAGDKMLAPGMSATHYSPRTPMILADNIDDEIEHHRKRYLGVITYNEYVASVPQSQQILLSENDELGEAAKKLYAAMHMMDTRGYEVIIARRFPDTGIGLALNDRLQRAAIKL